MVNLDQTRAARALDLLPREEPEQIHGNLRTVHMWPGQANLYLSVEFPFIARGSVGSA